MKVVSLWSGGKDSCFANYRAKRLGYDVLALLNFTNKEGKKSLSHGLSSEIIRKQAELNQIPIIQKAMSKENYRQEFKNIISAFKKEKGIKGIVFGDIYLQEHKDWIDKVCQELGVKAILPLWGKNTKNLIFEIINSGFEAIVVSAKAELLDKEWLGRKIDKKFIDELNPSIDPCGEKGEFHTFVVNGPLFKRKIEISKSKPIFKKGGEEYWFLDIKKYK